MNNDQEIAYWIKQAEDAKFRKRQFDSYFEPFSGGKMTTNKEWCQHTKVLDDHWWYCVGGGMNAVESHVNYCEWCGKPRPEEPKALWRIYERHERVAKKIALESLEWFNKHKPEADSQFFGEVHYIRKIHQWIDKEKEKCK